MQGDHFRATPEGRPERVPLKTHKFRWDPFERLRLARRSVAPGEASAFPKRAALAVGAAVVATGALAGANVFIPGDERQPNAELERSLDRREARLKQREDKLAELERRRAGSENEIKESEKRIADLERRRADLQRQVAELTAPISPAGDEREQPSSSAPTDRRATLDGGDPSPPDEFETGDAAVSASSRAPADEARPSTAAVEPAAAQQAAASETALHPEGPVRVFIHVRSADPVARERAEAVAAELRRRGVAVAQIRGVVRPVRRDAVRFYYDADREAVSALQDAVRLASPLSDAGPQSQDFRGYRAPPKPGTLELWLS